MKLHSFVFLLSLTLILNSCLDNLSDLVADIQPTSDLIDLKSTSFLIPNSNSVEAVKIYSRINTNEDSLLLGYYKSLNSKDSIIGDVKADILGQVICDLDFQLAQKNSTQSAAVPDSIQLVFRSNSIKGDWNAPFRVKVYEMTKGTFSYTKTYYSDINPNDYYDSTQLVLGSKIFTKANSPKLYTNVSIDSFYTKIDLSKQFLDRFTKLLSKTYASQEEFNQVFNGLYITTDYGSSTMLNLKAMFLNYYYHYKHKNPNDSGDSSVVNSVLRLPINNSDGRVINRIVYTDLKSHIQKLDKVDSLNYITTPAGIYTKLTMPLSAIKLKMDSMMKDKKQIVNAAVLDLEINSDTANYVSPYNYMLLIKESERDEFFKTTYHSSLITATLGRYTAKFDSEKKKFRYFFHFDLVNLINNEFKNNKTLANVDFLAVPVKVVFDNYGTPQQIQEILKVGGVSIRSPKHKSSPMRVKLIYSGY